MTLHQLLNNPKFRREDGALNDAVYAAYNAAIAEFRRRNADDPEDQDLQTIEVLVIDEP